MLFLKIRSSKLGSSACIRTRFAAISRTAHPTFHGSGEVGISSPVGVSIIRPSGLAWNEPELPHLVGLIAEIHSVFAEKG